MKLISVITTIICCWDFGEQVTPPRIFLEHDPYGYTTTTPREFTGKIIYAPQPQDTPDFKTPEPFYLPYVYNRYYREEERPYRLFPHYKTSVNWNSYQGEEMRYAGCYCTTVYKRLTPLAGCAIITTRHVLTTATSTHLVLKDRKHFDTLEDILGLWYDTDHNNYNSSMYMSVARIHYHPLWHYPEQVNRSHPFSFTFDLAVWATTYTFYGGAMTASSVYTCLRAGAHPKEHISADPTDEMFVVVGYQFMYAYNRKPAPWFKYGIRTRKYTSPCPKVEWGWFICIKGDWARFGIDSGAALHRYFKSSWRYNGLVGLGAFSMKLRSVELNHYFTVLDCYVVLDFLIDAYDSRLRYEWLDKRFEDTKNRAPMTNYSIPELYVQGEEHYFEHPTIGRK